MKKTAIFQAGGPTAVINSSLIGFLNSTDSEVFGVINGFQGLVEGDFFRINEDIRRNINQFQNIPGAYLGAGRYPMSEGQKTIVIKQLQQRNIHSLVGIGGNGTISALYQLSQTACEINYELQIVGIPKTVDNDLAETDHSPGFASAARYVASTVRDISKDLEAMRNFEQVRIIETMGRNVGWLAAASGLLKNNETDGPHAIYLPEQLITIEEFLTNTDEIVQKYGFATIVVSEGVSFQEEGTVEKAIVNDRIILGGISTRLAKLVTEKLHFVARDEILGINQRASQSNISTRDLREAYEFGEKAACLIDEGTTNVMVVIQRVDQSYYKYRITNVPLKKVFQVGERPLPKKFIDNLDFYYEWLRPLVGYDLRSFPSMILKGGLNENKTFKS